MQVSSRGRPCTHLNLVACRVVDVDESLSDHLRHLHCVEVPSLLHY